MTPPTSLLLLGILVGGGQGIFHPDVNCRQNCRHDLLEDKIQTCNPPSTESWHRTVSHSQRSLNETWIPQVQARFSASSKAAPRSPAKPDGGDGRAPLLSTGVLVPAVLSLFRFLPLPPSLSSRIFAHLIDPPVLGNRHAVPLLGLGLVPTRGQALFIAYLWILNIALTTAAYPPSATRAELMSLVGHRVGLFSFVNLALTVLYASRNSILLHLTDWSHATFLLLHRWTAVISILQACLHSAIFLQKYHDAVLGYAGVAQKEYLTWGVVALVAMVVIIPVSTLPFRRREYEAFLACHILLSAMVLVGCCLHISHRYGWRWEYQAWIMVALGIWGFDRLLARPIRIWRNGGLKEARVSVVDRDYLMIEVPGVTAGGHAYRYFPSLSWRFWENHPFSVAAVSCPAQPASLLAGSDTEAPSPQPEEKNETVLSWVMEGQTDASHVPGIVFFVRCQGGVTTELRKHAGQSQGVKVLVESSYGADAPSLPRYCLGSYPKYPNLVCIAGGVGITAMLPLLKANASSSGKTELYWGVRSVPLVEAVARAVGQEAVVGPNTATNMMWGHARVSILVGMRFDLKSVLDGAARRASGGTTVAVCGPPGMADEVRSIVTGLGRKGVAVRLRDESFGR